jgi:hypothetical protein
VATHATGALLAYAPPNSFDTQGAAWRRWLLLEDVRALHGLQIAQDTLRYSGWLITNVEVVLTLVGIGLGIVAIRRFAWPYKALTLASLIMPLTLARPFSPLTSVPRYYLVIFPLFWALAEVSRRPAVRVAVLTASTSLLVLLTLLFASWHDVL